MMRDRQYFVYIMASKKDGVLYVGVTNNLIKRVYDYKSKLGSEFTTKYKVFQLVYYETCEDVRNAIGCEKRIKRWNRAWKIRLIETINPNWNDLYTELRGN